MRVILRVAAAGAVAVVLGASGYASAEEECREEFGAGQRVTVGPLTVYTDNAETYVGVCGFGHNGYVQANEVSQATAGNVPLLEGRTGVKDVDHAIGNGPTKVWVVRNADGTGCAPAGDKTVGGGHGDQPLTKGLPTVYTDGGSTHVGVCDSDGNYVQVNDPAAVLAGEKELVERGNRGGS